MNDTDNEREGFREETQVEIFHQDEDVFFLFFFFFLYAPCAYVFVSNTFTWHEALLSDFTMTFRFSFIFLFSSFP